MSTVASRRRVRTPSLKYQKGQGVLKELAKLLTPMAVKALESAASPVGEAIGKKVVSTFRGEGQRSFAPQSGAQQAMGKPKRRSSRSKSRGMGCPPCGKTAHGMGYRLSGYGKSKSRSRSASRRRSSSRRSSSKRRSSSMRGGRRMSRSRSRSRSVSRRRSSSRGRSYSGGRKKSQTKGLAGPKGSGSYRKRKY